MKIDTRPHLGNWAPGTYIRNCFTCKEQFQGDKRATQCSDCAYTKDPYEEFIENEPLPSWVEKKSDGTYMEIGAQLCTRDGNFSGNAFVNIIKDNYVIVLTDAGNTITLTEDELKSHFYPPKYVLDIDNARKRIKAIEENNYRCVITETKEKDYSMVVMLLEVPEFPTNDKESSILGGRRLSVLIAYQQYKDGWVLREFNQDEKTCIGEELARLNSKVNKWYWCELYTI